jgi:hypothetical protein
MLEWKPAPTSSCNKGVLTMNALSLHFGTAAATIVGSATAAAVVSELGCRNDKASSSSRDETGVTSEGLSMPEAKNYVLILGISFRTSFPMKC